jgi:hypothetical protein
MITIHKFPLQLREEQEITLRHGAQILDFQIQRGSLCCWALINTEKPEAKRTIIIVGTGHAVPKYSMRFISTVQDGAYVWHIFEIL